MNELLNSVKNFNKEDLSFQEECGLRKFLNPISHFELEFCTLEKSKSISFKSLTEQELSTILECYVKLHLSFPL